MSKPGLRPPEAVGEALRASARYIRAEGGGSIEDKQRVEAVAVHDFRASMKWWRAYLRLIEPFLDAEDHQWRTEARDMARLLAGARDAQAALDAVNDMEHHTASHRLSGTSWETIVNKLEDLRAHPAAHTPDALGPRAEPGALRRAVRRNCRGGPEGAGLAVWEGARRSSSLLT